jgi:Homeodomain-like domain
MPRARATQKSRSSAQMQALREDALRELAEFEAAIVRTRDQLKFMEGVIRRVRKMTESGRSPSEVADAVDFAKGRAATSAVIREVQAARHRAQRAQFKLAAAEGATMAEIARQWGVSRQLVSRMVKEPSPRRRRN